MGTFDALLPYSSITNSLQCSVASIYFSNGTSVNIAKIEGGPSYKQMMRANSVFQHTTPLRISFDDASDLGTADLQVLPNTQHLHHYLPSWLGGNVQLHQYLSPWFGAHEAHTQALSGMLKALNTAIESHLEIRSSTVEVVFPFPVSNSHLDTIRSACASLSFYMPMSAQPPAGVLAARLLGIGEKCTVAIAKETPEQDQREEPAQLILAIDYSRAALTAMLISEECGVFEYRRVLHNVSLGTNGLSRGLDSSHSDLTNALRDIVRLPLEDGNGAGLTQISHMVLMGESASDQRLADSLKESLGEQFGRLGTIANDARDKKIDPLFAASNGVAQDCLDRKNFQHDGEAHDLP